MDGALVTYRLDGPVATITMDDGKANALSPRMLAELDAALDRAAADGAVVLLTGREGIFSAGFDLKVLAAGGTAMRDLVAAGFTLAERVLGFPAPVVAACGGHAMAMAAFLLACADHRIGARGPYKIATNEVAIGITMPRAAVEICAQRLTPAFRERALVLAEVFPPEEAVAAGFLDRVVDAAELEKTARETALALAGLDRAAHAATKRRVRGPALAALRAAIEADRAELTPAP
ncbi:crotonase/enoyl-CoA hydratase family protein [Thermocatellispora tengchongensis]|uniref:crotonase/enoyl-CoA hydratase family protein n=1 Tax=Thermocatellispora tengchongensis TaxID=1073253 RepID=UPI0033875A00